eukprot:2789612-Ditylum_brightwellii.AAC.1
MSGMTKLRIRPPKWDESTSTCLNYHVRGWCRSLCTRSHTHRHPNPSQIKDIATFIADVKAGISSSKPDDEPTSPAPPSKRPKNLRAGGRTD